MDTITLKGLTFSVEIEPDHGGVAAPWDEHDGHGPVRNVRYGRGMNPDKKPGERVMHKDNGTARLYNWAEAMRIAKRDGWGMSPEDRAAFEKNTGFPPTPGQVALAAVQKDFDHLRRYCEGEWYWCGVVVTLLDVEGEPTHETESLWGIESDSYDYHKEVARECAQEIAARIGRRKFIETKKIRVRK